MTQKARALPPNCAGDDLSEGRRARKHNGCCVGGAACNTQYFAEARCARLRCLVCEGQHWLPHPMAMIPRLPKLRLRGWRKMLQVSGLTGDKPQG